MTRGWLLIRHTNDKLPSFSSLTRLDNWAARLDLLLERPRRVMCSAKDGAVVLQRRWAGHLTRRSLLACAGATASGLLLSSEAQATLVRGLTLAELSRQASLIVTLRALDSICHYQDLGGRKSIVTDTLVRVEDVLAKTAPAQQELVVRTLGGRIGSIRELLLGQPALSYDRRDVAFLLPDGVGQHCFVGMAQGHYRLVGANQSAELAASSQLPAIRDWGGSAVLALSGRKLSEARSLIQRAVRP